jgi:hypothetical protein
MRALGALLLLFWVSYLCPTGLSTEKIEVDPNSTSADVYKRNNAGAIPSDILPTELPISHSCGVKDNGKKTVRSLRIMLSSTDEYFPVFLNWLVFYNKICPSISSLYMICLDPSVEMRIKKYGLSCAHVFHVKKNAALHQLWAVRAKLTLELLKGGYDVLMVDSDALFLQNPFKEVEKHISSDIISSRGAFPESIGRVLGASLCMGFVYVKASMYTVRLWGEIHGAMTSQANPDDQRETNMVCGTHYYKTPVRPDTLHSSAPKSPDPYLQR